MGEPSHSSALMGFVSELQKYCNISNDIFVNCLSMVMSILDKYNSESTVAHRQRLVWKLSNRTLRHLRPTDKLRATLPTINETGNKQMQNRTSHESLGESYDSLSLSSEEDYEDDIDDSYDDSSDHIESANIENTEEETQVTNE